MRRTVGEKLLLIRTGFNGGSGEEEEKEGKMDVDDSRLNRGKEKMVRIVFKRKSLLRICPVFR